MRMDEIRKLSSIRRSELPMLEASIISRDGRRLIDKERIRQWGSMKPKDRARDMHVYFDLLLRSDVQRSMFQEALRKIYARRRMRVLRYLFRSVLLLVCVMFAWKWWEFGSLPRVYAIGSGITVRLSDGSLRDFSFQDGREGSLVENGLQGDSIQVMADNFLEWAVGRPPSGMVSAVDFIRTKDSLERYEAIFEDMEGTSDLASFNSAERRRIFRIIQLDPRYEPLKILSKPGGGPKEKGYSLPFLLFERDPQGLLNECFFVSLECTSGIFNVRYILNPNGTLLQSEPLILNGGILVNGVLRWKKPARGNGILFFTNGISEYQYTRSDAPTAVKVR